MSASRKPAKPKTKAPKPETAAGAGDKPRVLAKDSLSHTKTARSLLAHAGSMPAGTVIAVQGAWGRGKTDTLRRISQETQVLEATKAWPAPVWLNPWQYGTPDLLTPLVTELVKRIGEKDKGSLEGVRKTAETLLRAANAIMFKGLNVVVPHGNMLEAASRPVDDYIRYLFGTLDKPSGANQDVDTVAVMADRFRDLVGAYLEGQGEGARLIICIDDLDRCLPDHQVAILEALYFLTSARADATFLIALDPTLVKEAAIAHYGTAHFDTDQYLNKIFDLRINLPAIRDQDLNRLIAAYFERPFTIAATGESETLSGLLSQHMGRGEVNTLVGDIQTLFWLPSLRNPRLIDRTFSKAFLFMSVTADNLDTDFWKEARGQRYWASFFAWLALAERWPVIRSLLQHLRLDDFNTYLHSITRFYDEENFTRSHHISRSNFFTRLPALEDHPDIGEFFRNSIRSQIDAEQGERGRASYISPFPAIDDALVSVGL